MKLYLVIDTSGSMSEGGKRFIARGVARFTEQYVRLGYGCADMVLVLWSDKARIVEWDTDQEIPNEVLESRGSVNFESLLNLIGDNPEAKVAIITDGFFSRDNSKAFKVWRQNLQLDSLRVIKVGADSVPNLKEPYVYSSDDLFSAYDGWLQGGAE